MTRSYLIFLLSGRLFGAQLSGAIEVVPWRRSRPVPMSFPYVEGLIDYRGFVYPVFNLAQWLGMSRPAPIGFIAEEKDQSKDSRNIILLEEHGVPFGIIVDSIVKMAKLEDPVRVPNKSREVETKFMKGIAVEDEQDIVILDFERLLYAG
ncbi:MAG TPA: chemotaxis protein CheW [Nitrospirota bacterium]|nr:chemotaxis protein CheW [Nitrospirota bacterium]